MTRQNNIPSPDVISALSEAILSDDANQSERLVRLYTDSEPSAKDLIDDVLIIVCGYSLPTLIRKAEEGEQD